MALAAGTHLGPFTIVGLIGAGGMGEVYLADDTTLDRRVALKVLTPALANDPARLDRFEREAKAVASLNHPHIVTIHAVGEADGLRFIAMELVEGETLSWWVRPGGLPIGKVCEIGIALADALTAAHEKGIVHRDLKPSNVMITREGRVKVLDFGLAKLGGPPLGSGSESAANTRAATLTSEGAIVGTVPYMSPEQLQALPVDHRTDLFSLGVVLYELVVGERPFVGDNAAALTSSILRDAPPPLGDVRPDVPGEMARIVGHCLRKDVRDRYQTARELYNNLRELHREVEASSRERRPSSGSHVRAGTPEVPTAVRSLAMREAGGGPGGGGPPSGPGVSSDATSHASAPLFRSRPADRPTRRDGWPVRFALATAVVLLVAGTFWIARRGAPVPPGVTASAGPPSVAVMPFIDLSPERNQQYFTLGLAEELVNGLARLPDLRVAAYKLRRNEEPQAVDARAVGEQMHVGTVLTGSVTKAGDRVRIRVQLVKIPDAYNLWAETFDRRLDDIFAVQDEIARAVASALQVKLLAASHAANVGSPEAYNLVLQAQYLRNKGGRDAYATALRLLQQAAKLDPGNARVFAEMSRIYLARASDGFAGDAEYGESWKAANHAVELDSALADAHQALGWFNMVKNWDWTAAEASFKKALALEPRNVRALRSAAALAATLGRIDEAIGFGQRAAELEPTNAGIYYNLGIMQRKGGQLDAALINGRRAIELDPNLPHGHFQIGAVHLLNGHVDDAMREFEQESEETSRARGLAMGYYSAGRPAESATQLRELITRHRDDSAREIAQVYAWRNEKDRAFEWLDRAYAQRDIGLAELKGDPLFRNIQRDPRWTAFLTTKMKLPG